jgi:hypothetical protein
VAFSQLGHTQASLLPERMSLSQGAETGVMVTQRPQPIPASSVLHFVSDPNNSTDCLKSGPVGQETCVTCTAGTGAREGQVLYVEEGILSQMKVLGHFLWTFPTPGLPVNQVCRKGTVHTSGCKVKGMDIRGPESFVSTSTGSREQARRGDLGHCSPGQEGNHFQDISPGGQCAH